MATDDERFAELLREAVTARIAYQDAHKVLNRLTRKEEGAYEAAEIAYLSLPDNAGVQGFFRVLRDAVRAVRERTNDTEGESERTALRRLSGLCIGCGHHPNWCECAAREHGTDEGLICPYCEADWNGVAACPCGGDERASRERDDDGYGDDHTQGEHE
jgi:hypothetical protein